MDDSAEWGPWIEHDGGRCPYAVGDYIGVRFRIHPEVEGRVNDEIKNDDGWLRESSPFDPVTHHRIRKPRGLTILEGLLEHLPDEVDA